MIGKLLIVCCVWALVMSMMIGLAETKEIRKSAAISDSGYNSHKQLHIEQEPNLRIDKYNLKKGFGE